MTRHALVARAAWPVAVGAGAFLFRFLTLGAIENDHFVMLARAYQVLDGDWPVRDFVDPGMPLAYLLSAVAAWIGGNTLLSDAVLHLLMFAVATALAFALARRASGSVVMALAVCALILVFSPRLYNSSKVLVHVAAIALAWWYADRPSVVRASALGAWTAVAFLFRHDYGLYIAIAVVVLLAMCRHRDRAAAMRDAAAYAGVAVALIAPWLIYVGRMQGIADYTGAAMRFSAAEATRTAGIRSVLFYVVALPAALTLLLARRTTAPLSAPHIVTAAVLVLLIDVAFLRDVIVARTPDVLAPTAVLVAWLFGRFVPPRTVALLAIVGLVIATTGTAVVMARSGYGIPSPADVVHQWSRVSDRLRRMAPEIATTRAHAAIEDFAQRCTAPSDRILTIGFGPEIPVLARRPFAGGLPTWVPGYYNATPDVDRALAQIGRERIGLAVMLDGTAAFTTAWPTLADRLVNEGFQEYTARAADTSIDVWLPSAAAAAPRDTATGLPCVTNAIR